MVNQRHFLSVLAIASTLLTFCIALEGIDSKFAEFEWRIFELKKEIQEEVQVAKDEL